MNLPDARSAFDLREALATDRDPIHALHLAAFPAGEGASVAKLAVDLLDTEANTGAFGLLAVSDDRVLGHVGFSPVEMESRSAGTAYILSPLAVAPDAQGQGVGAALIEAGIQRLAAMGVNLLFVYGDPAYYGRFGFDAEIASRYSAPYALEFPFGWQALVLNDLPADLEGSTLSCVPALRVPELW